MSKTNKLREEIFKTLAPHYNEECDICNQEVDAVLKLIKAKLPEKKVVDEDFELATHQGIGFNIAIDEVLEIFE